MRRHMLTLVGCCSNHPTSLLFHFLPHLFCPLFCLLFLLQKPSHLLFPLFTSLPFLLKSLPPLSPPPFPSHLSSTLLSLLSFPPRRHCQRCLQAWQRQRLAPCCPLGRLTASPQQLNPLWTTTRSPSKDPPHTLLVCQSSNSSQSANHFFWIKLPHSLMTN